LPINVATVQSDGKILVGGEFAYWNGVLVDCIVRLNSDGTRDTTFTTDTNTPNDGYVICFALQSDGDIVVGGDFTLWGIVNAPGVVFLNLNNSTSVVASGLTANGTSYIFRVLATNVIGSGPYSDASSAVANGFPAVSGGTLTSDSTYYYRTFTANGTLAIVGSINLNYFAIAGGGGGGFSSSAQFDEFYYYSYPSGGGAAGTKTFSSSTFAAGSYAVTIGAGGGAASIGSSSSIASAASVTGGGQGNNANGPANGGSNAEYSGAPAAGSLSGGGAGAGGNASGATGGNFYTAFGSNYGTGGNGQTTVFSYGSPNTISGSSGAAASGSGGGGSTGGAGAGAGGSGIVIVRYLKTAVGG
jgi:hypothetical protein